MPNWIQFCSCLICCLLLFSGCQPVPSDSSSLLLYQQPQLALTLSPATAPVETPLSFTITSTEAIAVIKAELTGVSMFMGKIPMRFVKLNTPTLSDTEQWQAEFLLGACSDPAMLWQLSLTVLYADGRKLTINERFNSSW